MKFGGTAVMGNWLFTVLRWVAGVARAFADERHVPAFEVTP